MRTALTEGPKIGKSVRIRTVRRTDPEHWVWYLVDTYPGRYTRRTNAVAAHV